MDHPRPEFCTPTPRDSEFERGFKEGVWAQMRVEATLRKSADERPCIIHVVREHSSECIRCRREVVACEPEKAS